ncbi:MAG: hypothetical protein QOH41_2493 [Blastocatellia bacterium]|jgi:hypothetical protein|nr:hypothetical protein [Blastocatellia bacterium]
MEITAVTFTPSPVEADPIWVLRVEVKGGEFQHRAAPVVATVGDVPVEAIIVRAAGDGFVGHLRASPPDGAKLKIGYLDTELVETDFTYSAPFG